jgi:NhaA family Na+:H+ antiporter
VGGLDRGSSAGTLVFLGVTLGLAVGKPMGVLLFSWVAVRLKLCVLPAGMDWKEVGVVGVVAGIGFTMAIFISELAFAGSEFLGVAKLAVLLGTALSAGLGLALGWWILRPEEEEGDVVYSDADVEASTEYWTTGGH